MKKMILYTIAIILAIYFVILIILYFAQEKLIFFPEKFPDNFKYNFDGQFEEKWINTSDNSKLNTLLFKADSSKGIILYLHGNTGCLNSWGNIGSIYTHFGYDVLIPDYRGYGKSQGKIKSEKQLLSDVQSVYNSIKENYPEEKITVIGCSLGTGLATYLASVNNPKKLILLAPYYNFPDLIKNKFWIIPSFLLKYRLMTNEYITKVNCAIYLFHGKNDELIYYQSSEKLYKLCKPNDKIYLMDNQGHDGIDENSEYTKVIEKLLLE
jgi:esterase/lipase